jgi:hypothetical protein
MDTEPSPPFLSISDAETPTDDTKDAPADPRAVKEGAPPEALHNRPPVYSGWLIGIICGVVAALWALPPVRYTLGSQLSFALAEDNIPWMKTLDARRILREAPALDAAAANAPDDYLMRVGRATALVETSNGRAGATINAVGVDDRALLRLTIVTKDFPNHYGACAHLARYMMLDRVRIIRAELAAGARTHTGITPSDTAMQEPVPARTVPATHRDVRLMEWALRRGEQLEPDNAFWPAMLATTYFAAERDQDGLRELHRVNRATRWDAYLYEEILGQWRLYSLAYGDHGAIQKIGPLSLLAFPHLREIRHMAQLARWYAEKAARQGDVHQAIQIRHSIARLGRTMRETASWAYEALYGTELTMIAYTDGAAGHLESVIQQPVEWRSQATHFLALLSHARLQSEVTWVTQEVEASCALRKAVNLARSDASYPGIPPGIPLASLFASWMAGISLIQQCIALLLAAVIASAWMRWGRIPSPYIHLVFQPLLVGATIGSAGLLFLGVPTEPLAIAFLVCATLTILLAFELLSIRRQGKSPQPHAETLWQTSTTIRMLALLLAPGLAALALLRPTLSSMHPVAILLSRWFGSAPTPRAGEMLLIALLAGALPLAIALASGLWGLARNVSPISAATVGLRRTALPAIACLVIVYILLLQRTLLLDAQSSSAINEAARNDRQWVLTHSADDTSAL